MTPQDPDFVLPMIPRRELLFALSHLVRMTGTRHKTVWRQSQNETIVVGGLSLAVFLHPRQSAPREGFRAWAARRCTANDWEELRHAAYIIAFSVKLPPLHDRIPVDL